MTDDARLDVSPHLLRVLASVPVSWRVLDLACGEGDRMVALARLGFDAHACDADPARVAELRERLASSDASERAIAARPDALGYPDAYFDWVVWADAPTVPDPEALAEIRRVLKPGAWVYVATRLAAPDAAAAERLAEALDAAGLASAEAPATTPRRDGVDLHTIYRRVEADTAR